MGKVRRGKVKVGEGEVCKSERGAFRATVTAIVGEGRTKDEGTVPVRVPREAVIGTGEGETELAGG